jgi:F-type H+-transporting ATPase subunit b
LLLTSIPTLSQGKEADEGDAHGQSAHGEHHLNWVDFSHWFGDNEDPTAPFIALLFNFGVMGFLVFILLRKPMGAKFKNRRENLKQALDEAKALKAKAEKMMADAQGRMDAIDTEMANIRNDILQAGNARSEQILEDAEKKANRLRADTKAMLEQEVAQMIQSIREELADQIITAATKAVNDNLSTDDHNRLTQDFLGSIKVKDAAETDGRSKV